MNPCPRARAARQGLARRYAAAALTFALVAATTGAAAASRPATPPAMNAMPAFDAQPARTPASAAWLPSPGQPGDARPAARWSALMAIGCVGEAFDGVVISETRQARPHRTVKEGRPAKS